MQAGCRGFNAAGRRNLSWGTYAGESRFISVQPATASAAGQHPIPMP